MSDQPSLFDLAGERVRRDLAIAQADEHAPDDWRARARAALAEVARSLPLLCSDDVWATGLEKPREARALGAVFQWARREGMIVRTSQFRQSAQVGCHAMDVRVWQSLIYER